MGGRAESSEQLRQKNGRCRNSPDLFRSLGLLNAPSPNLPLKGGGIRLGLAAVFLPHFQQIVNRFLEPVHDLKAAAKTDASFPRKRESSVPRLRDV